MKHKSNHHKSKLGIILNTPWMLLFISGIIITGIWKLIDYKISESHENENNAINLQEDSLELQHRIFDLKQSYLGLRQAYSNKNFTGGDENPITTQKEKNALSDTINGIKSGDPKFAHITIPKFNNVSIVSLVQDFKLNDASTD